MLPCLHEAASYHRPAGQVKKINVAHANVKCNVHAVKLFQLNSVSISVSPSSVQQHDTCGAFVEDRPPITPPPTASVRKLKGTVGKKKKRKSSENSDLFASRGEDGQKWSRAYNVQVL